MFRAINQIANKAGGVWDKEKYMNINELEQSQDEAVFKCPTCGEFELRNVQITDSSNGAISSTDTWQCDEPDCFQEYHEDHRGNLIPMTKS